MCLTFTNIRTGHLELTKNSPGILTDRSEFMKQFKKNAFKGAARSKVKKPSLGLSRYQITPAVLMVAAGIAVSSVIGDMPSGGNQAYAMEVDASFVQESTELTTASYLDEDGVIKFAVPQFSMLASDMAEQKEAAREVEIDLTDYTVSLSSEFISEKLEAIRLEEEKAAARRASVQTVTSSNRNLYADGYYYGADSLPESAAGYVRLNSSGIPMSELQTPASLQFDENGVPLNYVSCIEGKSTAYYSGTTTATGTAVRQGSVAVDPREIPYGTEMWITSLDGSYVYGYCRAEDTGGFIYFRNGATVDLYMRSYDDCVSWGWRGVKIYILN